MTTRATSTTTVSISLDVELDLSEEELFPDGRPETLPPGPLKAGDLAEYLKGELRSFSDLSDWGFWGAPTMLVQTPEGDSANVHLREML